MNLFARRYRTPNPAVLCHDWSVSVKRTQVIQRANEQINGLANKKTQWLAIESGKYMLMKFGNT
jgi:hypothetical protein